MANVSGRGTIRLRRLAVSVGVVCALLALGAFFYVGEHREVEARASRIASEKAIWATAEQRKMTYAEVVSSTNQGCRHLAVQGGTDDGTEKSTLALINHQQCIQRLMYGGYYEPIWERQRLIEWLELPAAMALAALAGFLSFYCAAGAVYLIRDRWWPWVQGR